MICKCKQKTTFTQTLHQHWTQNSKQRKIEAFFLINRICDLILMIGSLEKKVRKISSQMIYQNPPVAPAPIMKNLLDERLSWKWSVKIRYSTNMCMFNCCTIYPKKPCTVVQQLSISSGLHLIMMSCMKTQKSKHFFSSITSFIDNIGLTSMFLIIYITCSLWVVVWWKFQQKISFELFPTEMGTS